MLLQKSGGFTKSLRRYVCWLSLMQIPSEETAQAALLLWPDSLPYYTGCLYRPDLPKFMRKSKFQAATWIFTNSCEISKILTWLLSVLSLSRKFVCDHCCCPISAIILTTSKLEAILQGCCLQQITTHSNSYSSFSLSFCPLCTRRGFDKKFARSGAEQFLRFFRFILWLFNHFYINFDIS